MGQGRESRLAYVILGLVSMIILTVGAFQILKVQHEKLNQELNQFIYAGLASYTDTQKQQIVEAVEEVKNTLSGLTVIMEAADLSPDGEWLQAYLKQLNNRNSVYQIEYISSDGYGKERLTEPERELYDQALKGEGGTLNILAADGNGEGYFFSVAEPVEKNGRVSGILFSRVEANVLMYNKKEYTPFKRVHSMIIKSDGSILYSDADQFDIDESLLTTNIKNGITASFPDKGKDYYVSAAAVGINDWNVVNFVRSPDVIFRSEHIFITFFITGILLVVLTLVVCITIGTMFIRQKQKLKLESQRYAVLSQFTDTLLFEYDYAADTIEFTSNAKKKLCLNGLRIKDVLRSDKGCQLMHPDDWQGGERMRWALLGCKKDEVRYSRIRLKSAAGEYRWFSCQYKILYNAAGRRFCMVGKLEDIMDQLGREEMLINEARKDPLTGVYNRSGEQIINKKLASGKGGIFFMIDLDNFKDINDTCGHAAGDMVLTWVAGELDKLFGDGGIVSRVGGDEFVVYVPVEWKRGRAREMAEAILQVLKRKEVEEFPDVRISASIGIAAAPKNGTTYGELYCAADKAMYYVKQKEKEGYAFYQNKGSSDLTESDPCT